jgi:nucleotide-binding universal stress UspA family protein
MFLTTCSLNIGILSQTNGRFSRILLAVDGSGSSMDAAAFAIQIAKKDHAQLIALTVIHIPSSYGLLPSHVLNQWKEKDTLEAQRWFDSISKDAQENKIPLKIEFVESSMSVEGAIVNYAEDKNIDLIVIGTRGRSGFKKMLLGSVAAGVVTYATCPVLVVK